MKNKKRINRIPGLTASMRYNQETSPGREGIILGKPSIGAKAIHEIKGKASPSRAMREGIALHKEVFGISIYERLYKVYEYHTERALDALKYPQSTGTVKDELVAAETYKEHGRDHYLAFCEAWRVEVCPAVFND